MKTANYKECSVCEKRKNIEEFYKKSACAEARRPECKVCSRGNNKSRYSTEYNTIQCRKWVQNNAQRSREIKNRHQMNSIDCRIRMALRNRLFYALSGRTSEVSAVRHMGCTIKKLRAHLESQFKPGMTWDNWSQKGWHVDHIKPLASFDLTDDEQVKKAVHFTNLQPLWAFENQSKGAKCQN